MYLKLILTLLFHCQAADAVTPTENRRRSARLSSKGRSSTDGLEETSPKPPVLKRSRKSRENGKDDTDGG